MAGFWHRHCKFSRFLRVEPTQRCPPHPKRSHNKSPLRCCRCLHWQLSWWYLAVSKDCKQSITKSQILTESQSHRQLGTIFRYKYLLNHDANSHDFTRLGFLLNMFTEPASQRKFHQFVVQTLHKSSWIQRFSITPTDTVHKRRWCVVIHIHSVSQHKAVNDPWIYTPPSGWGAWSKSCDGLQIQRAFSSSVWVVFCPSNSMDMNRFRNGQTVSAVQMLNIFLHEGLIIELSNGLRGHFLAARPARCHLAGKSSYLCMSRYVKVRLWALRNTLGHLDSLWTHFRNVCNGITEYSSARLQTLSSEVAWLTCSLDRAITRIY